MAISVYFSTTQPSSDSTSVRFEINYTLDHLAIADAKRLGKPVHRIAATIKGYKISPLNFTRQQVLKREKCWKELNERMSQIEERAKRLHSEYIQSGQFPPPEKFKIIVQQTEQEAVVARTFESDFLEWVQFKQDSGNDNKMLADAKRLLERLTEFFKNRKTELAYQNFNTATIAAFEKHLITLPGVRRKNTVVKHLSILKNFWNYALREGLTTMLQPSKYRIERESDPFPHSLSMEEVEAIHRADLRKIFSARERGTAEISRDLFVVACLTGLRHSDWARWKVVEGEQAGEYNLQVVQQKTTFPVIIPLFSLALDVFKKYDFDLPLPLGVGATNNHLRKICEAVKIEKPVTSKFGRRTFATLMVKKGVPRNVIMKITGHRTEAAFNAYVGVTFEANASLLRDALPEMFAKVGI